ARPSRCMSSRSSTGSRPRSSRRSTASSASCCRDLPRASGNRSPVPGFAPCIRMSNSQLELLAAIASPSARALPLLDPTTAEARQIRAAHWVLEGDGPVTELCARLPRLVAQLSRRTSRRRVEESRLRGRIDWSATVAARIASGSDASMVSRITTRSYDLPENQLLHFVVARCIEALDRLPAAIRNGMACEVVSKAVAIVPIRERVELRRAALRDRQLQQRLALVALPHRVATCLLDAARSSDVREYTAVVAAYQAWAERVEPPTWNGIAVPGGT